MKMNRDHFLLTLACAAFGLSLTAGATPFDPVFRILRYQGECRIAPSGSADFAPVRGGKAYPLGSTVRTAAGSSAQIALSDNNECRLDAGTAVIVEGEAEDRSNRVIRLIAGRLTVELDDKVTTPSRVEVRTPLATASAEKSRFETTLSGSNDLYEVRHECLAGVLRVSASEFEIPIMKTADTILLSGDPSHLYLRARTTKGAYPVNIRNDAGELESVPMKNNSVIKIWQRYSVPEGVRGIVNRVYTPDGLSATNFSYTQRGPATIAQMSGVPPEEQP